MSVVYGEINKFLTVLQTYNLEQEMPIKGKVILDLPCGPGDYVRKYYREGAIQVIASDVVAIQLEISKKQDREIGVPEGFAKYYVHDAKVPRVLSDTLADVCSCLHLLCFAENHDQLLCMARTLSINLKPGAICVIVVCSAGNDHDEVCKALESHDELVIHLDPPTSDKMIPRKIHSTSKNFNLERYIWPHEVICEALEKEGFSSTKIIPCGFDKNAFDDPEFVEEYIKTTNRKIIIAKK